MDHEAMSDEQGHDRQLDRRSWLRRAAMTVAFTAPLVITSACGWVPKIPKK